MSDPLLLAGGSHSTSIIQLLSMRGEVSIALAFCGTPGTAKNDVCIYVSYLISISYIP